MRIRAESLQAIVDYVKSLPDFHPIALLNIAGGDEPATIIANLVLNDPQASKQRVPTNRWVIR